MYKFRARVGDDHVATGSTVNSGVTSVVGSTGSVITGPATCTDPGPPSGSAVGTHECGFMPCSTAATCEEACRALYDCGLANCGGGKLCPGLNGLAFQHDSFILAANGCRQICLQAPGAFKSMIDPTDCSATIHNVEAALPPFTNFCKLGPGGG